MKKISLIAIAGLFLVSTTATAISLRRDVAAMNSVVATNSLIAFTFLLTNAELNAPVIHSQWYVDRMTNADERAKEQQNRDFGAVLVRKLADTAATVCSNQPYQVYETNAIALMRLGKWITVSEGYGNLLLGYRCYDIAYICLARMVLDVSCPADDIEPLIASYDMSWYNSRVVVDVFNRESGARVFGLNSRWSVLLKPRENIDRIWAYGRTLARSDDSAASQDLEQIIGITPAERVLVRSHIEFFKDTCDGDPEPLTSMWNKKSHETVINRMPCDGTDMQTRTEHLRAVLRFRATVGHFPTNIVLSGRAFDNMIRIERVFEAEWKKHYSVSPEHLSIEQMNRDLDTHNTTADMYVEYLAGLLIDEDAKIAKDRR